MVGIIVKKMHLKSAAIVLGRMCYEHFVRVYIMNRTNVFKVLFDTPIAAVVMTACVIMLLSPVYEPFI